MKPDESTSSASEEDVTTDIDREGNSDDESADIGLQEKKVCPLHESTCFIIVHCLRVCLMPELNRHGHCRPAGGSGCSL